MKGHPIVITLPETKTSYVSPSLNQISSDKMPYALTSSDFGFADIGGGQMAVGVLMQSLPPEQMSDGYDYATETLSLALHEAFHAFGQKDFFKEENVTRDGSITIKAEPRLYRKMIITRLAEAILNPASKNQKLALASYWYGKYNSEFLTESQSVKHFDRIEGSASYVESMTRILSAASCSLSSQEFLNSVNKEIAKVQSQLSYMSLSPSSESYKLGFLSGLLLKYGNVAAWESKVIAGQTPLEILMKDIVPAADSADDEIVKKLNARVEKDNQERINYFEPIVKDMN
jgi:hypothetical protein